METPSISKVVRKGKYKAYDPKDDILTIEVTVTDNETDLKHKIDINYHVSELERQITDNEATIVELQEKNQTIHDLLELHESNIMRIRSEYNSNNVEEESTNEGQSN